MPDDERCSLTEMLVGQCACKQHRNSPEIGQLDPADVRITATFLAQYDGRCALDPAHPIAIGDVVGMAVTGERQKVGATCIGCTQELEKRLDA